ncbi:MAG: hypothetical protein R3F34_12890 [Planctomycetota bacterium]
MRVHWHVVAAVLFALLADLPWFARGELEAEESRRVLPAEAMLATGDYVVPRIFGRVYLAKPPLYYWWTAANQVALERSGAIDLVRSTTPEGAPTDPTGADRASDWVPNSRRVVPAAARLASILSTVLLAGFVAYVVGRSSRCRAQGLVAGAAAVAMPEMLVKAPLGEIETTFVLTCVVAAVTLAAQARRPSVWRASAASIGLAAALLTKGPIAFALAALPAFTFAVAEVGLRGAVRRTFAPLLLGSVGFLWWPIVAGGALDRGDAVAGWAAELGRGGTGGLAEYLRDRGRFVAGVLLGWLPASALVLFALGRGEHRAWRERPDTHLALHVIVLGLLVLVLWPSTRARYALPLAPFAAVLAASFLVRPDARKLQLGAARSLAVLAVVGGPFGVVFTAWKLGGIEAVRPLEWGACVLSSVVGAAGWVALRAFRGAPDDRRRTVALVTALVCLLAARLVHLGPVERTRTEHRRVENATAIDALAPQGLHLAAWNWFTELYYVEVPVRWCSDPSELEVGAVLMTSEAADVALGADPRYERIPREDVLARFEPPEGSRRLVPFQGSSLWRVVAPIRTGD